MTRVWLAMSLMEILLEFVNIYCNIQQTPFYTWTVNNTIDKLKLWNFCTQIPSQKCTRQRVSTDVSFHKLIKLFSCLILFRPHFQSSHSVSALFFFHSWPFHDILLFISHCYFFFLFLFILSSAVSIEIIKILLDSSAPPTIIICFIFQVEFFLVL